MNHGILHQFTTSSSADIVIADIHLVTAGYDQQEINRYKQGHSHERALQLLCADRLVAQFLGGKTYFIHRDEDGSPSLPGSGIHISISHTSHYMAMIFSKGSKVAIDIEVLGRNITRIRDRFTTDEEHAMLKTTRVPDPILHIWSIKECLFKLIDVDGVLFREHFLIDRSIRKEGKLHTDCSVVHPGQVGEFSVVSCIFEPLILSYIDCL